MKALVLSLLLLTSVLGMGQTFSELIKVVADDRESQDRFGWSVAISENYAIAGAYTDDFGASNPNMGSAYIFEKTGIADWEFVQKINNSDQDDYDRFGWSVAIDGNYAIIGAYAEDHNELDAANLSKAGSAYIFERDGAGMWNEVQKLVASDRGITDEFGWSVDISGTTAIVGAHFESHDVSGGSFIYRTGSAYIFDRMGDGTWVESQKIVASDRADDILFPGGGTPEEVSDQFGSSVSISGNRLIVGAYHHDYDAAGGSPLNGAGAAYIFERTGGTWTEVEKLDHSDRETEDRFGFSVSIDGDFAAVSAYTEDENATGGTTMANAGSVYIFERNITGEWSETQKIVAADRSPGDRFGWDVCLSNHTLVVGAINCNTNADDEASLDDAGAAYSFSYNTDLNVWEQINKMDATDRQAEDEFGASVAVSGQNAIIGAYQQNLNAAGGSDINDAGAAYFFNQGECTTTSSSQTLTLCAGQTVEVGPYTHETSGTYTDIIFSVSGCDSVVTTNLTILPAPSSTQEINLCFGYTYSIGESDYTESGSYTDIISGVEGCDSLVYTNLTVTPENAITQDVVACWGESYTIGASTYETAGIYTDVITSWALCDCTITTNLSFQLPVDKSISQNVNTLSAGSDDATYQWIKCNPYEEITGATEQTYVAPSIGEYAVVVTEGACADTSSCVYVDLLSTYENPILNGLAIYPNPSAGTITVTLNTPISAPIEGLIINGTGQIVHKILLKNAIQLVDLNNLPPGVYVLTITTQGHKHRQKLILQ